MTLKCIIHVCMFACMCACMCVCICVSISRCLYLFIAPTRPSQRRRYSKKESNPPFEVFGLVLRLNGVSANGCLTPVQRTFHSRRPVLPWGWKEGFDQEKRSLESDFYMQLHVQGYEHSGV